MRREEIVAAARGWLGTPYRHQACRKGAGCDCLGLVRGVYAEVTGRVPQTPPPYTPDWAEARREETLAEAARRHLAEIAPEEAGPGDILLFRWRRDLPAKHLGIVSLAGWMIHAHDGARVAEVPLGIWARRIAFAFRFRDLEE